MAAEQSKAKGPDLAQGVPLSDVAEGGMIGGHVGDDAVLLVRRGDELFAIGATCSHYGGPLAEGLIVGDTVRCPWHHACFSLRTGEAVAAPAFNPMPCWRVEERNGSVFVREKIEPAGERAAGKARGSSAKPERVVIVGGGAAGFAAAEMLRREGFAGSVIMLSSDETAPYDRPNCSKDYLAGNAPEEWMPLRPPLAISYARYTSNTASYSISRRWRQQSMAGTLSSKAARHCRPIRRRWHWGAAAHPPG